MSKYLVVEFPSQKAAYEGSVALQELHNEGSITVYGAVVITKGEDGTVKIQDERDQGFIGTALGTLTGSLIGILAGPAGVAAGMLGGGMIGWLSDMENLGVGSDFADDVSSHMKKGDTALVAEIEEYWATPVNTRMHDLDGKIYRKERVDFVDQQRAKEMKAWKKQLKDFKKELSDANEKNKAAIQKSIDEVKAKIKASNEKIKARWEEFSKDTKAKMETLKDQSEKTSAENKEKIDKRMDELDADLKRRHKLLKKADALTKEALT